ncbi:META domain-containing protein [Streptomyces sp. SID14478]|uniref:META domain-containing protein n=1 Tax=Streptomyces sp. SID14478 TaxID=2706073 RepID=UPI0013E0484E|nr:META domain-containing protein [Streptomyces sp. SID14478]NEB81046.1 META domain-containing protein [Streptomyces sp. SID14478]
MFTQRSTRALFTAALPLAALTAVAACGNEKAPGTVQAGGVPLTGATWHVQSMTVDGATTKAPSGAYVKFLSDERVRGNYGCNSFDADARVTDDSVDLGKATVTDEACTDTGRRAFNESLARALADKNTIKAQGDDRLTLTRAGGDTIALAKQRDARLTGTKWMVDTLYTGDVARSLPKAAQGRARLVFGKDGHVDVRLGCNSGRAKATVKDGHLTFGPLTSTKMGCVGEAAELEKAMRGVLDGRTSYAVKGDALTVTAPDGTGIGLSAAKK